MTRTYSALLFLSSSYCIIPRMSPTLKKMINIFFSPSVGTVARMVNDATLHNTEAARASTETNAGAVNPQLRRKREMYFFFFFFFSFFLLKQKKNGNKSRREIEFDGLLLNSVEFLNSLFDQHRSCSNSFCFKYFHFMTRIANIGKGSSSLVKVSNKN